MRLSDVKRCRVCEHDILRRETQMLDLRRVTMMNLMLSMRKTHIESMTAIALNEGNRSFGSKGKPCQCDILRRVILRRSKVNCSQQKSNSENLAKYS